MNSRTRAQASASEKTSRNTALSSNGPLAAFYNLSTRRTILLICVLSVLAYANSLGGDFVFDDMDQIVDNHDIRSWSSISRAFTTHVWSFRERPDVLRAPIPPPYYRPVFTIAFTIGYHLFGLWPQGWHLVSLLLHILCSVGVFYVVLAVSNRKSTAAIAAVLFAVYPLHSESVSWISGVTDPLYGVFFLAAFYCYVRVRQSQKTSVIFLSLALFLVSAYSKETSLSLVPLVFVYELIRYGGENQSRGVPTLKRRITVAGGRALPFFGVALLYLIPRYFVLGGLTWKTLHTHEGPFTDTLITLPSILTAYLGHLLWPVDLTIAYDTSFVTSINHPRFLFPSLLLTCVVVGLLAYRKRITTQVWYALAFILVPLLPTLDLRNLSEEYLIFDRYLYISVAGWCWLIALGLNRLGFLDAGDKFAFTMNQRLNQKAVRSQKSMQTNLATRLGPAVLLVLLMFYTLATARENRNWADAYSLWSNAARIRPNFWATHYNTGLALMQMKRYTDARDVLLRAARLAPEEPFVFDALGRTYEAMGDMEKAVESFETALEVDPTTFESLNNLGTVYFNAKDYDRAEHYFSEALKIKPRATPSRFNLAKCHSMKDKYDQAARELAQVTEEAPDDGEAFYELGMAYERMGQIDDAARAFRAGRDVSKTSELSQKLSESLSRIRRDP